MLPAPPIFFLKNRMNCYERGGEEHKARHPTLALGTRKRGFIPVSSTRVSDTVGTSSHKMTIETEVLAESVPLETTSVKAYSPGSSAPGGIVTTACLYCDEERYVFAGHAVPNPSIRWHAHE